MWILKNQTILNTDNISVMQMNNGELIIRDASGIETRLPNVPEDVIHQIWMAHKKGQEIFVISAP